MIFGVTLGPIIGKGAFGAVYAGTWNGAKVAVKSITSQDFTDLYNEAFVLRSMRHPNIVQVTNLNYHLLVLLLFCFGSWALLIVC